MYIEWVGFVIAGALAGFVGGLLGVGGGLVTVPVVLLTFFLTGLQSAHEMQIAVGTSLAAMVFTAASSAIAHYFRKGIVWHLYFALAPGILVGAILGAVTADYLPSFILMRIFGISTILVGLYFFFLKGKSTETHEAIPQSGWIFLLMGVFIGFISTILGIGGGIITVPLLTAMNTPLRNAISTSAATGFIIALFGALSFLFLGLNKETMGSTLGFIYLPAFFLIGITSVLFAPLGAKFAYTWPASVLYKIFAFYLIAVGLSMVL